MAADKRTIKVFIASPGDLAVERRAFKDVIDELNTGFGRGADVEFVPLGWEDALAQTGRRSQSVINRDIDACDVFVLVMWRRWGQEAPDAMPYTSYTEEEFYRALTRFERSGGAAGGGAPEIFVFFKHIDPGQMGDPGEQLKKVLAFRRKLEETRSVLYRGFADETAFRSEIDRHLCAFAKGELDKPGEAARVPLVPESIVKEMEELKAQAKKALEDAERARAEARDAKSRAEAAERIADAKTAKNALVLAENAAKAALEGKIEEARQAFAMALEGATNLQVLDLGYQFFRRIGELDEAEGLIKRWLALSGPEAQTRATAAAYGNLGLIEQTRGNLDGAEAFHKKALAIDEKLGRLEGMAIQYGNLGNIEKTRGNLDEAEEYLKKSLAIDEKLGRQEGMAIQYGNLGLIEKTRGNLDEAEEYLKKSLAINEKLGRQEGMAIQYGNLGNIEKTRGNLDGAEAYRKKSLAIEEKLGRLEGMASDYGNLGNIERKRGNKAKACALWRKARDLFRKIGAKDRERQVQGWLDDAGCGNDGPMPTVSSLL